MRRLWCAAALAGLLLTSCAGIPRPESETDALVVGYFAVDYPDGFYDRPARTITTVRLDCANVTTGAEFWVTTSSDGYFYFLSTGGQHYEIKGFGFTLKDSGIPYTGGGTLSYKFATAPHSVRYVGHFQYRSAKPRQVQSTSRGTYWTFENSAVRVNKIEEMKTFLNQAAKDTPWMSYDIQSDPPQ
jgi:hypothetical protein